MKYLGVEYPDHAHPSQRKPSLQPLPCPFCGKKPKLFPTNPREEGNAWGSVCCTNRKCPVQPEAEDCCKLAGEFGTGWYMDQAIKRWNTRAKDAP